MNKQIFLESSRKLGLKKVSSIGLLFLVLLMPEQLIHLVVVVIHTVYESLAYMIEELLVHGFGLSKFQAQMIVFYSSLVGFLLGLISLIQRLPKWFSRLKNWVLQGYCGLCAELRSNWLKLPLWRKIQLMLLQFFGVFSVLIFMIS